MGTFAVFAPCTCVCACFANFFSRFYFIKKKNIYYIFFPLLLLLPLLLEGM